MESVLGNCVQESRESVMRGEWIHSVETARVEYKLHTRVAFGTEERMMYRPRVPKILGLIYLAQRPVRTVQPPPRVSPYGATAGVGLFRCSLRLESGVIWDPPYVCGKEGKMKNSLWDLLTLGILLSLVGCSSSGNQPPLVNASGAAGR